MQLRLEKESRHERKVVNLISKKHGHSKESTIKLLELIDEFISVGYKIKIQKSVVGTSLVVQWLRICLPMQGTWV